MSSGGEGIFTALGRSCHPTSWSSGHSWPCTHCRCFWSDCHRPGILVAPGFISEQSGATLGLPAELGQLRCWVGPVGHSWGLVANDWRVAFVSGRRASRSRRPETLWGVGASLVQVSSEPLGIPDPSGLQPLPAGSLWALAWQTPPEGGDQDKNPFEPCRLFGHRVLHPPFPSPGAWGARPQAPSSVFAAPLWACQECREIRGRGMQEMPPSLRGQLQLEVQGWGGARAAESRPPAKANPLLPALQTEGLFLPHSGPSWTPRERGSRGWSRRSPLREVSCLSSSCLKWGLLKSR